MPKTVQSAPDTEHLRTLLQRWVYTPAMSEERNAAVEEIIAEAVRIQAERKEETPRAD